MVGWVVGAGGGARTGEGRWVRTQRHQPSPSGYFCARPVPSSCDHSEEAPCWLHEKTERPLSGRKKTWILTQPSFLLLLCPYLGFFHVVKEKISSSILITLIQSLRCVRLFATPWTAARQASWSFSISQAFAQTHIILCHPLLPPSIFPSIRIFSHESAICIRWPEYWSFSISPSNEYSGLISFRIDWLDLLAVQGTLKILL